MEKICPICFENLGKTHRTLQCGHKFHYKCLHENEKQTISKNNLSVNNCIKHNCPYCRQEYTNMVLRKRVFELSQEEKEKQEEFSNKIKKLLSDCSIVKEKKEKFMLALKIYEIVIKNKNMLLNKKFGFILKFVPVVKEKVKEIDEQIEDLIKTKGLDYIGGQEKKDKWNSYKNIILTTF